MTVAPGGVIYVAHTIKPDLHKFIQSIFTAYSGATIYRLVYQKSQHPAFTFDN